MVERSADNGVTKVRFFVRGPLNIAPESSIKYSSYMLLINPLMSHQFRLRDSEIASSVQDIELNLVSRLLKMSTHLTVKAESFEQALYLVQTDELRVEALYSSSRDVAYTMVFSGLMCQDHSLLLSYAESDIAMNHFEWSFESARAE